MNAFLDKEISSFSGKKRPPTIYFLKNFNKKKYCKEINDILLDRL